MSIPVNNTNTDPQIDLNHIYGPIQNDLEAFRKAYQERLQCDDTFLQSINDYAADISGKLLRPSMTLLTANATGGVNESAIDLAIAVELLHTATLIHDDIVDASETRRNKPTINAKWGNSISTIYGDYIYAHAFAALSNIDDLRIHKWFARTALKICVGEMKQVESRGRILNADIKTYLSMIENKTAALFKIACMIGAYSNKVNENEIKILGNYGYAFGMLYQIADDCLDLIGEQSVLGKVNGTDVKQNDYTLPMLLAAEELALKSGSSTGSKLNELLSLPSLDEVTDIIRSTDAVRKSVAIAEDYASNASRCLAEAKFSGQYQSLAELTNFTLQRLDAVKP